MVSDFVEGRDKVGLIGGGERERMEGMRGPIGDGIERTRMSDMRMSMGVDLPTPVSVPGKTKREGGRSLGILKKSPRLRNSS